MERPTTNMKKAVKKWMKSPERKKAIHKKKVKSRNKFRIDEPSESTKKKLQKALEALAADGKPTRPNGSIMK